MNSIFFGFAEPSAISIKYKAVSIEASQFAKIAVSDYEIGFEPEQSEKIF